ncbi:glycosyltransferase family 4 protein [Flavobacterium oreochromis]|uniref:Glycoside hydrolase n=2 Tax=Flavobacterium TaxID=237 RepID=A0A246GE22_9FLAO|nr:glycosyltransferase family 4 protein [Flavobacterium oreochromis]OWP76042.1 glycoside hydrolase [Flavobacterium oreochromis]OWP79627.1 glycoside hydrolase [Flavobacterium oreochromis]QYS86581.1 glycosyltransferase family 4 protein [Flavobacterium oreochromis]
MKIAYLTPEYPHIATAPSGGIGTSIRNLTKSLVQKGHQSVIFLYGQKQDKVWDDEGVTIISIKNVKLKGFSWYFTRRKIERLINEWFDKGAIQLIEAPDWTGITAFIRPKKCPVIIRLHGSDTYFCHLDNRKVKRWNRFLEKKALANADAHISVSAFTAKMTNMLFNQNKTYQIIPNGIVVKDFTSSSSCNNKTLLYFGTLIRKKGLLELPLIFNKVIENCPQAKLILIGRDSTDIISGRSSTWEIMKELFSPQAFQNVDYIGGLPYQEVKKHIDQAAVCVFPSFAEALPVSWIEAMVMEKAIVASNIGWATEMLEHQSSAMLVNPKEHQAYAAAIVELLENKEKNIQFGENARKIALDKFDQKKIVEKNCEFYSRIINK